MNKRRVLEKMLAGTKNLRFRDLVILVEALGFRLVRVNGSHHIFVHPDVPVRINLQEVRGQAKPYQMRQVVEVIEEYGLTVEDDSDEDKVEQKGDEGTA